MSFPSWLGFLRSTSQLTTIHRRRRTVRKLHLEPLEDRCLLASGLSASLVADLVPGAGSSNPQSLTNVNGTLFFGAVDPSTNAAAVWKSDGTASGTVVVKDTSSSSFVTNLPSDFTAMNGSVFFSSNGLWKTDGTAAGTIFLSSVSASDLTAVNGKLFFAGSDPKTGVELWESDGTAAGTVLVKDIYTGTHREFESRGTVPNSSYPQWLTNFNGMLFFAANDGKHGVELWKSDGTTSGTTLVKDIVTGSGSSWPRDLTVANGVLYFGAVDPGTSGAGGLWKSDGTTAGTVQIKRFVNFGTQINSYAFNTNMSSMTQIHGELFFPADDGSTGMELWKSDDTAAGTVVIKDINPGSAGSNPQYLTNVNGTLYFVADDGVHGQELWKSNGTATGTVLVKDINPGSASAFLNAGNNDPPWFTNVNGLLYFAADDGVHGNELWQSDGTAAGTLMVQDIYPGSTGSFPSDLVAFNNKLYFAADDGVHGRELWDPPSVGTQTSAGSTTPFSTSPWHAMSFERTDAVIVASETASDMRQLVYASTWPAAAAAHRRLVDQVFADLDRSAFPDALLGNEAVR